MYNFIMKIIIISTIFFYKTKHLETVRVREMSQKHQFMF